jgi:hypothetical protein
MPNAAAFRCTTGDKVPNALLNEREVGGGIWIAHKGGEVNAGVVQVRGNTERQVSHEAATRSVEIHVPDRLLELPIDGPHEKSLYVAWWSFYARSIMTGRRGVIV